MVRDDLVCLGALAGAWQGFWIAYVEIPAFIVTLAGMMLFRGLTLILLTGGTIGGLPPEFIAMFPAMAQASRARRKDMGAAGKGWRSRFSPVRIAAVTPDD